MAGVVPVKLYPTKDLFSPTITVDTAQSSSTVHPSIDYLADGFCAQTLQMKFQRPGLTATFLIRIEDVTDKVNEALNPAMSEGDRNAAIAEPGG
jgi:hypothetical protein